MQVPSGHSPIRFGFIQVGDYIFVPAIGSYIEVEVGSIYLGSSVDSHNIVQRKSTRISNDLSFSNHTERCDHVREHDSVDLIDPTGTGWRLYRVVSHKDSQYVYLRKLSIGVGSEGVVSKVCRRTGKVWEWTPTGWDPVNRQMKISGEGATQDAGIPMSAAKALRGDGFYGD